MSDSISKLVIPLLLCFSLSSLAAPEGKGPDQKPHTHHPQASTPYQKPGAPIRILSPDFVRVEPGSETRVEALFSAPREGTMRIKVLDNESIEIKGAQGTKVFSLETDKVELVFTLLTPTQGQYHVMFQAEYQLGKQKSERVFGIPVYVGDEQPTLQKSHPERIELPAEERIRSKNPKKD